MQLTPIPANNPGGTKVVDAIWNFGFRDEVRLLLTNSIDTAFGEASRSSRVQHLLSNEGVWNALTRQSTRGSRIWRAQSLTLPLTMWLTDLD